MLFPSCALREKVIKKKRKAKLTFLTNLAGSGVFHKMGLGCCERSVSLMKYPSVSENLRQVTNPYLPSWEYVPDGEPYVFGDRVYVYGSHDFFNGGRSGQLAL